VLTYTDLEYQHNVGSLAVLLQRSACAADALALDAWNACAADACALDVCAEDACAADACAEDAWAEDACAEDACAEEADWISFCAIGKKESTVVLSVVTSENGRRVPEEIVFCILVIESL